MRQKNKKYVVVIIELHMATIAMLKDWWLDYDITIHVCNNNMISNIYNELKPEEVLTDNHVATKVFSKGCVKLNFT